MVVFYCFIVREDIYLETI